jgi:hypothetical protein
LYSALREDSLKDTVTLFLKAIMKLADIDEDKLVEKFMKKRDRRAFSQKVKLEKEELELQTRIQEIEIIIKKLYEDSVFEKITDERFKTLSDGYEAESKEAKTRLLEIKKELAANTDTEKDVKELKTVLKGFTSVEPLTTEIVHSFIEKIVVSEDNRLTIVLKMMKGISLEDIKEIVESEIK